jgi:hypothetical protein
MCRDDVLLDLETPPSQVSVTCSNAFLLSLNILLEFVNRPKKSQVCLEICHIHQRLDLYMDFVAVEGKAFKRAVEYLSKLTGLLPAASQSY